MPTATLLPMARAVFYDANGDPLSAGFVHTYIPGGTVAKTTWQDAAEATPNANPIVLDSGGSCLLYGSGAYQLTVTDSLGNAVPAYTGLTQDFLSVIAGAGTTLGFIVTFPSVAALRGNATAQPSVVFVASYYANVDGGGGAFWNDTSDTASADNGGTIIVDGLGNRWFREGIEGTISAKDYGVYGDGLIDATTTAQAALDDTAVQKMKLIFEGIGGNNFKITAPLEISAIGQAVEGVGPTLSTLTASGDFDEILLFTAPSGEADIRDLGFVQTGTTTKCVALDLGSQAIRLWNCKFTGDLDGALVYSQCSGFFDLNNCAWQCDGATTIGVEYDGYNQNCSITGGRAGGIGEFLAVVNTTGSSVNGLQGLIVQGVHTVCQGAVTVSIAGDAYQVQLLGNIFDQASTNAVVIGAGAQFVTASGNWIGLAAASVGQALLMTSTSVDGHKITGNTFYGGSTNLTIQASVTNRVAGVQILDNTFQQASGSALVLDSVNGCIVEENQDFGPSANGSYATTRTHASGGAYTIGSNSWSVNTLSNFDTASSYRASGYDRGVLLKNSGTATAASGTTITFAHGLITAPNIVIISQVGTPAMDAYYTVSGANVTITYSVSGAATFTWTAEVFR